MSQEFTFTDGSLATGSGGITGVERLVGADRQNNSTPFTVRRGSRAVIRRTVFSFDQETATESAIDISGGQATAIVWHLLADLKRDTAPSITKTLLAGDITLPGGGANGMYEFVLDDSDTVALTPRTYWAELAIVVGGNRMKFQPYRVTLSGVGNMGE